MEFTVDITARVQPEANTADLGDRLLDELAQAGAVAPAVSQDLEASTVGATLTVAAPRLEEAWGTAVAVFRSALAMAGLASWQLVETQVTPSPVDAGT